MRILIEAICAEFGGIRTYAEHLIGRWPREFPDDEVHVAVRAGSNLPLPTGVARHQIAIPTWAGPMGRPLAQATTLPRLVDALAPDVILATLPSTFVRRPTAPLAVVVYDLRHELRPHQFSRGQRLLRRFSYRRGYDLADAIIAISQRTMDDLHIRHPLTRTKPSTVVHLGADHVDTWIEAEADAAGQGPSLTFAHHTNKNLDLVLDGWEQVQASNPDAGQLLVVGLDEARRLSVQAVLRERDLAASVTLAPFLPEPQFRQAFSRARALLFPSDFEGFGLPVAEAMRLCIPVVIGPEPATQEVAGGHAVVMSDWTPKSLAEAVNTALSRTTEQSRSAREFAERYTWAAAAHQTRDALARLVATE